MLDTWTIYPIQTFQRQFDHDLACKIYRIVTNRERGGGEAVFITDVHRKVFLVINNNSRVSFSSESDRKQKNFIPGQAAHQFSFYSKSKAGTVFESNEMNKIFF